MVGCQARDKVACFVITDFLYKGDFAKRMRKACEKKSEMQANATLPMFCFVFVFYFFAFSVKQKCIEKTGGLG